MNERTIENFKLELKKNKLALVSIFIIIIFVIASSLAFLSPYQANQIDIGNKLLAPSFKHIFGTDDMGRDYFTRALYGGRVSLTVGIISMIISTIVGTLVGTISGYFGGRLDNFIMRTIDVIMCIPTFFLILILDAYLKPGIQTIILIIGLFSWMGMARIVRAETMSLRTREYVLCARVLGASPFRIIFKHIIPNVLPTIIVASAINIANAIMMESSLSFLGLGVRQPNSSWGSMLQNAQGYIGDAANLAIFPGLLILFTVLSFNVVGDLLRATFDFK